MITWMRTFVLYFICTRARYSTRQQTRGIFKFLLYIQISLLSVLFMASTRQSLCTPHLELIGVTCTLFDSYILRHEQRADNQAMSSLSTDLFFFIANINANCFSRMCSQLAIKLHQLLLQIHITEHHQAYVPRPSQQAQGFCSALQQRRRGS